MSTLAIVGLLAGAIHLPLALAVWLLLRAQRPRLPLYLWVGGSAAMGLSLMAVRVPPVAGWAWVPNELAMGLAMAAMVSRTLALRRLLRRPLLAGWLAAAWAVGVLGFGTLRLLGDPVTLQMVGHSYLALAVVVLAWHAAVAGLQLPSRSASVLAVMEGLLAGAIAVRVLGLALGWSGAKLADTNWPDLLLVSCLLASSLYSNPAYLGLVLDQRNAARDLARRAQQAERIQREAAEASTLALQHLLDERDRLAAERERLLQVLAHEIRQPLHNASGALQAAAGVLRSLPGGHGLNAPVGQRLRHAQAVLVTVQAMLDNTLVTTTWARRAQSPVMQETELDFLVALVLGDLSEEQRGRVQVHWAGSYRSAELEPGLVRLALRNLLLNALQHAGEAAQITLLMTEQDEPAALLLCVQDNGPGLHPATPLAPTTERRNQPRGAGLGLAVARRVAGLHGGELRLSPQSPHGLAACLVLPQPAEPAAALPDTDGTMTAT